MIYYEIEIKTLAVSLEETKRLGIWPNYIHKYGVWKIAFEKMHFLFH